MTADRVHDAALRAIHVALREARRSDQIRAMRNLSGGCIHQVSEIELTSGEKLVAKVNSAHHKSLFDEECAGLVSLLATRTVLAPQPLAVVAHEDTAVLLMTLIKCAPQREASSQSWRRFGEELAALHSTDAGPRYGFQMDNHVGSTPQPNAWRDDWIEFNAVNRLGFQLRTATDGGLLDSRDSRAIQDVIDRLDRLIPARPRPALLHGDLWSGNALVSIDAAGRQRIAVIDPACSIGDGWADIAMMRLFGGFPPECYDAYAANNLDHENLDARIATYQLYHVLNHVNIFGVGYVSQAISLAKRLGEHG